MKFKILAATAAMIVAPSVFAMSQQQPTACPEVSAFGQTGVTITAQDQEGRWFGLQPKSNFNTNTEWSFIIGAFDARNTSEALAKANAAIPTLTYLGGPEQLGQNMWMCMYQGADQETFGATITPALVDGDMQKYVRFMRR